jgi:hypothetical protein
METHPSNHYKPFMGSSFDIPTLDQSVRLIVCLDDNNTSNVTLNVYSADKQKHEIVVSRHDLIRVAEAMKILDPFRNI